MRLARPLLSVLYRYVATLEARIQTLERQLRAQDSQSGLTPDTSCSEPLVHEREVPALTRLGQSDGDRLDGSCQDEQHSGRGDSPQNKAEARQDTRKTVSNRASQGAGLRIANELQTPISDATILDMVHGRAFVPDMEQGALPSLPSSDRARKLLGTVYFYTQARYCITDWAQVREWHRHRDAIAYISTEGPVSSQIGNGDLYIQR